jgi:hypothetical protein
MAISFWIMAMSSREDVPAKNPVLLTTSVTSGYSHIEGNSDDFSVVGGDKVFDLAHFPGHWIYLLGTVFDERFDDIASNTVLFVGTSDEGDRVFNIVGIHG